MVESYHFLGRFAYEWARGANAPPFAAAALNDLVDFIQHGALAVDPRVARVIRWLAANPDDLTALDVLTRAEGLSASRMMHIFSRDIGVPFRRFRIWNRLRTATRVALTGRTLTDAALIGGFTDSAHYARRPGHLEPGPRRTDFRLSPAGD